MGGSGDDTRSAKRDRRLTRTPFAVGRYRRLAASGMRRWAAAL